MTSVSFNHELNSNLMGWLERLSPDEKLEVIVRLSNSLKRKKAPRKTSSLAKLYGAWSGGASAEAMIEDVRNARTFTRERETF